jgi:hypothetical protein
MPLKTPGFTEPRSYKVTAVITLTSEFIVDATSEEDAQEVAHDYIQDGEYGTIIGIDIDMDETYPVDELVSGSYLRE